MDRWKVSRHGGREGDWWRTLYEGPDPEEARRVFEKARENMRQGGVLLRDPRGEVMAHPQARYARSNPQAGLPRARTRIPRASAVGVSNLDETPSAQPIGLGIFRAGGPASHPRPG